MRTPRSAHQNNPLYNHFGPVTFPVAPTDIYGNDRNTTLPPSITTRLLSNQVVYKHNALSHTSFVPSKTALYIASHNNSEIPTLVTLAHNQSILNSDTICHAGIRASAIHHRHPGSPRPGTPLNLARTTTKLCGLWALNLDPRNQAHHNLVTTTKTTGP